MPWLRTGTVACTLNSTTVTGTGTGFVANARVGDAFLGPDGRWYEVANIASDTALSILPAYLGATVSAGSYALAPMQGYVKDSADQLRTLVNKFGTLASAASINALAAVTGGANKIAYFNAADQMATADFPAQARTLLAGTSQAAQRTALGLGSAAVAAIVGSVTQVGGVPTGAIIETGTNANGTYIKYADGTLECYAVSTSLATASLAVGPLYAGFPPDMVFPYPFVSPPVVTPLIRRSGSTTGQAWAYLPNSAPSAVQTSISMLSATSGATGYGAYLAKGRWF